MSRYVTDGFPISAFGDIVINTDILSSDDNYYYYPGRIVNYIVLHYTGNAKDTAKANAKYFNGGARKASAHYFVDDTNCYQSVALHDSAWAVGGTNNYKHGACRNFNSVSIEMCCSGNYTVSARTEENAAQLCARLCEYLNITTYEVDKYVIRHWDVWDKDCPAGWTGSDNDRWNRFKKRVKTILEGGIDMEELQELRKQVAELKALVAAQGEKYDLVINKMGNEIDALKNDVRALQPIVFDYIDSNMPDWARPTIQRLVGNDVLHGDEKGRLGLTYDMLRQLVILDRAGLF